jgi:pentatricopeptide repeat protein
MLSKGQGRTMGTYFTLLNALAADGRLDEAEELWTKLFSQYLDSMPRTFFDKMISIYHQKGLHDKMFEVLYALQRTNIQLKVGNIAMQS